MAREAQFTFRHALKRLPPVFDDGSQEKTGGADDTLGAKLVREGRDETEERKDGGGGEGRRAAGARTHL